MFSSFFILILAFPWLLISYIRFTKWTPAFSLGGSVNQLNGQAEPRVIMVRVLHLFKIQVSLTEQSCLIHISFVSWIKDFSSPSCWRLWEGYTTHSRAQNFWLPLRGAAAGAGGGGSGGRQSSTQEELEGPLSGFCGCLSCCCRAAGTVASCLGKGKGWKARRRRGQLVVALPALCPMGLHLAGCAVTPWRRALCEDTFPKPAVPQAPCSQPCPVLPEQGSHRFLGAAPLRGCSSFPSCSRAGLYLLLGTWWLGPQGTSQFVNK